ncbi:thiol:disulfide interchange protein DsbA/DsbL [Algiphilus sp.]|uniref:thiol:disulfide interchange protein DsbA/DsbL n=1 Tax=Algiphilus sp. TaxID=1872431 RepID=UPI003B52C570
MRRFLSRLAAVALLVSPLACTAQPETYVEGEHYKEVRNVETSEPGAIAVTEVFWYGCRHCYNFEPHINEWKRTKAEDVTFERLPTALGRSAGRLHVRAFYTAQELEVTDEVHGRIFNAIHQQGRSLASEDTLAGIFSQAGIEVDTFRKTFNSFTVENRTRRSEQRIADFGIASVPTVVVDGRWQVSAGQAGSFEEMISIINFLVDKARSNKG